ncbi:MAG: hypothetical protein SFY96_07520 [Planctomycetota bacterium]|nr:hypothetical protein [Planctomycetota bacterium]
MSTALDAGPQSATTADAPRTVSLPLLDSLRIASPCPASWVQMVGDDITRHCAQCDLDVHNISAMSREDAEAFLQARKNASRTCVRFFRRADGTILTQDCPVGLALWRRRAAAGVSRVAAAMLFVFTGGMMLSANRTPWLPERLRAMEPFKTVSAWLNPIAAPAPPITSGSWIAGLAIAPPPAPNPQPPANGGVQKKSSKTTAHASRKANK